MRNRKSFRPQSVEEIFAAQKAAAGAKQSNSLSLKDQGKRPAKAKSKPAESQTNKPRRKSKAEMTRHALGLEPEEDVSQMMILDWAKLQRWKKRHVADYIHHSPNGGKRSIREGAAFKKMGTKAGFPDLFLPIAIEPFHGLFIELKTSNGTVSASQREYHPLLIEEGYRVEVCYSAEGAINLIKNYLGLSKSE